MVAVEKPSTRPTSLTSKQNRKQNTKKQRKIEISSKTHKKQKTKDKITTDKKKEHKNDSNNQRNTEVNVNAMGTARNEGQSSKPIESQKKSTQSIDSASKPNRQSHIAVLYANADQLTHLKKFELLEMVDRMKPSIIAICEAKPKNGSQRTESDYKIEDYTLYSVNLESNKGRGIAVYVHTSMENSVATVTTNVNYEEACFLEIKLQGNDKLLFGCVYRSPTKSTTSEENNDNLNKLLHWVTKQGHSHICIVGDFNFKSINWLSCSTPKNEESKESKFLDTIRDCFLHQHVLEPTRARGNDDPSTIDLIFTNEKMQISDLEYCAALGKSDHCMLSFKYECYVNFTKPQQRFAYDKGDYESMRALLASSGWKGKFLNSQGTVDELWNQFKATFYDLRERFVPKVTSGASWNRKSNVPITKYGKLSK